MGKMNITSSTEWSSHPPHFKIYFLLRQQTLSVNFSKVSPTVKTVSPSVTQEKKSVLTFLSNSFQRLRMNYEMQWPHLWQLESGSRWFPTMSVLHCMQAAVWERMQNWPVISILLQKLSYLNSGWNWRCTALTKINFAYLSISDQTKSNTWSLISVFWSAGGQLCKACFLSTAICSDL